MRLYVAEKPSVARVIAAELGIHLNEKKTRIVKIGDTYKYLQLKLVQHHYT